VGVTSSLGDSSDAAVHAVRQSALLLSWASSCFIVALAIIVTTQLLYTEKVIVGIITKTELEHWQEKIVRVGVAVFAWAALGFQTAAILLFSQALGLFSNGSMKMARYGVVGGMGLVLCVTLVGLLSQKQGQQKIREAFHIYDTENAT
jgi:magnesium-transporting ATPase (P-type)